MTLSLVIGLSLGAAQGVAETPGHTLTSAMADAMSLTTMSSAEAPLPWEDVPALGGPSRMLALQDGDADMPETAASTAFGAKGSTRWTIKGQYGLQVTDTGNSEASLGLGMQWFIVDDFAFAPELNFWGFFQDGEDAIGGSIDFLFQWHMFKGEGWTIFSDFGCGILGTNHNVPFNGSEFNFTPQAGVGATIDVGDNRRWIIGVKWHHISNASLYADNPGRDSVLIYTGLNLPF